MAIISYKGSGIAETTIRHSNDAIAKLSDNFSRLSSGLRINSAKDDPAGLAMSSALRVDTQVFSQGIRNLNDGISALNIADSAVDELSSISKRLEELAQQSATGSYVLTQRKAFQSEADALVDEFNRIISSVKFNNRTLLDLSNPQLTVQAGYGTTGQLTASFGSGLSHGINSAGTFTNTGPASTADTAIAQQQLDFNGDGHFDIVTVMTGVGAKIQFGNGDGTFLATSNIALAAAISNVAGGDFNGDGYQDIMMISGVTGHVSLGNGNGTFRAGITVSNTLATNASVYGVTVADFNGDGKDDVATVADGSVSFNLATSNGQFSVKTDLAAALGATSGSIATGDFNGDGRVDIIADRSNSSPTVFLNQGGTFTNSQTLSITAGDTGTAVSDVNRDGYDDIVIYSDNRINIYVANSNGTFSTPQTLAATTGVVTEEIGVGDLTGDGFDDIIFTSFGTGLAYLFAGNGNGTFSSATTSATASENGVGLVIADFNEDGVNDFAQTNSSGAYYQANTTQSTRLGYLYLLDQDGARRALATMNTVENRITKERGALGAGQSRFEVALSALDAAHSHSKEAASRITDIDVAEESADLVRNKILSNAGTALLAQANNQGKIVLSLLQTKKRGSKGRR